MTVWGLFSCINCQAGGTCKFDETSLKQLYLTKELAQKALQEWVYIHPRCYEEETEATCYYDHCVCEDEYQAPCTYHDYLKAGEWAGLERVYIKELEVKEDI